MRLTCLTLLVSVSCLPSLAQEVAKLDRTTQEKLNVIGGKMSAAMLAEDQAEVRLQFKEAIELIGDQAGLPESPDEFRPVPKDARDLAASELPTAFDLYIPYIERQKWWRIGLDPSKTNHSLREIAAVIEGCLAARQISEANSAKLLAIAREAGDFLVWAQDQAGTGVLPFPAVRDGKGRPFEVAEAFYRRAEQNGTLDKVISKGWSVDDFDDGGLQFDNGLAGVALVHLYESTDDEQYERAAIRAADWAVSRRVVTNWNYNSFSVYLLAETYRITGDEKYLASAKKKALLGVLPGQLTDGPRRGRWADPHNARPAYHYIMVRGLAALAAVMPDDDPDQAAIVECLRLALSARNPDFQKGIFNADSSVEALIRVKMLPPNVATKLTECKTDEALATLERYAAEAFRVRKAPLGPAAWGQLLAYKYQSHAGKR
ncbi:MAG: hypothetical protein SFV81_14365 [Pirellulaceae bacterium]|nr:hypothetical protein [Pirellulaceae bacterium]